MSSPRHNPQADPNPYSFNLGPIIQADHYQPYNYHSSGGNSPNHADEKLPNESINLADNASFARNFKSRLYNVDPKEEEAKQKVQDRYREQLKQQMERDRRRKEAQKAKERDQDERLERKFYEGVRIEAQKKAVKGDGPNYFMMRTRRGNQPKLNNFLANNPQAAEGFGSKEKLDRTFYDPPSIKKRGGYHNQSVLDNFSPKKDEKSASMPRPVAEPSSPPQNTQTQVDLLDQETTRQQERISRLLLFQQNMLRKLDHFRKEIHSTNRSLHLSDEFEKVKLRLRSKPLNMSKVTSFKANDGMDDLLQNSSDLYHLPMISNRNKIFEGDRQIQKSRIKSHKASKHQDLNKSIEVPLSNHLPQNSSIKQQPPNALQRQETPFDEKPVPAQRKGVGSNAVFNDKNLGDFEEDPNEEYDD